MDEMTTLLKEINKNIEKIGKRTFHTDMEFVSNKTHMETTFISPIEIGEASIGFRAMYTYYSIPNVSETNNIFKFLMGNDDYTIKIPDGAYEVEQISDFIANYIKSTFIYTNEILKDSNNNETTANLPLFTINPVDSTGQSVIEVPHNCKVDFTVPNTIGSLLGFGSKILEPGIHYSDNLVNIVPINSISVCVKVNSLDVYGSTVNGDVSNRIYTFFPDVQPGEKINEVVENKIYYPIDSSRINQIQTISVSLRDQNGKIINNRNEDLTLILTLKYTEPY